MILKGLKCLEKGQYITIAKTAIGVQNGGVLELQGDSTPLLGSSWQSGLIRWIAGDIVDIRCHARVIITIITNPSLRRAG